MYKILPFPIILSLVAVSSSLTGAESDTSARYNLYDSLNFVAERLATQVINSREFDPFGLPQDLAKQLTTTIKEVGGEVEMQPAKPQQKLNLKKLQGRINVIRNGFILGNSHFHVSDQLRLKSTDGFFTLEVLSVEKGTIRFRDLDTNEVLKLNMKGVIPQIQKGCARPKLNTQAGEKVFEL